MTPCALAHTTIHSATSAPNFVDATWTRPRGLRANPLSQAADFSGVRSVAADKLKAARPKMGYQLVYELESLDGFGSVFVEPLGRRLPDSEHTLVGTDHS